MGLILSFWNSLDLFAFFVFCFSLLTITLEERDETKPSVCGFFFFCGFRLFVCLFVCLILVCLFFPFRQPRESKS